MNIPLLTNEATKIWQSMGSKISPGIFEIEHAVYKKLLDLFLIGNGYYFVFNFRQTEFEFVSKEIESLLGYQQADITVPFMMDKIHPEDAPFIVEFEQKGATFLSSLEPEKIMKYKLRYDFRIRKANGSYIRILQQTAIVQQDDSGMFLRSMGMHVDITHLKREGKPALSFSGMEGEPSYINVHLDQPLSPIKEILTDREKQVLGLLAEGRLSKEIAQMLQISKQTVDTHRKSMIHKTQLNNTAELIAIAIAFGWI